MSKKRPIRPVTFLLLFSSAAPNTVPQLERCSMGQNFFQGIPKIAAIFYNTSILGHKYSQDFWLGWRAQITCNDVTRNFSKEELFVDKDIVDWKIRSRGQCVSTYITSILENGESLNLPKKDKMGDVLSKLVYYRRESEGEAPNRGNFFVIFGKLAILLPLDHNSHVFRAFRKN